MRKHRFLAWAMALIMAAGMLPAGALAAPVDDAAASVNVVDITQTLDRQTYRDVTSDLIWHDFRTQGEIRQLTYAASLTMTDFMADYLFLRQDRLMDARFIVDVNVETDKVDFVTREDGSDAFVFRSAYLKPVVRDDSRYTVVGGDPVAGIPEVERKDGHTWFTYTIIVPNINDIGANALHFYAELILWQNGRNAFTATDIKAAGGFDAAPFRDRATLASGMTREEWLLPVTFRSAENPSTIVDMVLTPETVAKGKAATREDPYTVEASGSITGDFDYTTIGSVGTIGDLAGLYDMGYMVGYRTHEYGPLEGGEYQGWESDNVVLNLYSSQEGGEVPPGLNTEDHYAYIIGYPEDYYTGEKTDDQTRMPVKPNGNITRAEVATIFFRMLDDETRAACWSQTSGYSDVSSSNWFCNAVCTLSRAGILTGYSDGTFRPNGYITRAEFATIASRFFDETVSDETLFPDVAGHWAEQYINEAAAVGIVKGYEDGTFRPEQNITRAEAMAMVNRTLGRAPHQDHLLADMLVWVDNRDTAKWYYEDVQEATNSHEYVMHTDGYGQDFEVWTELLPARDWAQLEKEWSDAYSSQGGDVMD